MNESNDFLGQVTRVCQIIKLALASGVLSFGTFAVFGVKPKAGPPALPMLAVMVATVVVVTMARLVVPRMVVSKARSRIKNGSWKMRGAYGMEPKTEFEKLGMVYQNQLIVGSALLEGGAFMCLFTHMTQKDMISLSLAALLLVGLLIDLPTRSSVEAWLAKQYQLLQEEKQLAGIRP